MKKTLSPGEYYSPPYPVECRCNIHLRIEQESKKKWIPCVGHGENCPCSEKKITPPLPDPVVYPDVRIQ